MIPKRRPEALTTINKNWDRSASLERAILSMTAAKVSLGLSNIQINLTNRKNETPRRYHKSDMGYNGAGMLSIGKIADRTVGSMGCWSRFGRVVRHVHVHRVVSGRESDESGEGR